VNRKELIPKPRWRFARCAVTLLLLSPGSVVLHAQFDSPRITSVYPDISIEAGTHIRTAASYVADQNWNEAVDLYQKLIEKFGNKVVQVGSRPLYITVRDFCHKQLAAMPPRALQLYRQRVDAQAEAWFRAGKRDRDRDQLVRVIDNAFASSWGDDALDAIAELAFEAGDFDQASLAWGLIHPLDSGADAGPDRAVAGLIYPDTNLDVALIEAKQILCRIFMGQFDSASQAIEQFRRARPTARGTLGGVNALLADRLTSIVREASRAAPVEDSNWNTFAGNAQRNKVMPHSIDIGSSQWTAQLPQVAQARIGFNTRGGSSPSDEILSYHPLVTHGQVIVSARDEVRAYDLQEGPKNGEPLWTFRLRDLAGQPAVLAARPSSGAPQFTLTAHRGRLYVRMGAPETTLPVRRGAQPDSSLVCLDLASDGKELWRIQPEPSEPDLAFEGSPLVADGNVYIGVTRGGAMTHSFLACYDAATGAKRWRTLICESSAATSFFNAGSISHNLPTLGGGMVFYNTNLGAVSALDQRNGRVRWIATYPRKGRDDPGMRPLGSTQGRELSPCMYYRGLVFALPSDSEGVHAFDASTGELRWRTPEPPAFSHMLGVAHGNLICSGSQVVAIDTTSGRRVWQWADSTNMAPFGRGTLAGDYVYFPTKTHVYIIDQRTGVLARPKEAGALQEKHEQSPGNLVIGDGYLVVAQPNRLTVFCQYEVLIKRYHDLIAANPRDPEPHLRLARAAEANGAIDLAVEHYRATLELASADGTEDERAARRMARAQLHSRLRELAAKAADAREWVRAQDNLRESAALAPTLQAKLDVLLYLAGLWCTAGDPGRAVSVYQDILGEDALRGLGIAADGNRVVRADVEIAARMQSLLDQFGRSIYAPYDLAAAQLLAEAEQAASVASVERLLRTHPCAEASHEALLYLAGQYAENKQFAAANAAYKQVLGKSHAPAAAKIAAFQGLAQAQEAQQMWQAARQSWQRLAAEFPDASMPNKPEQSVASYVQERLAQVPYEASQSEARDRFQIPLIRRWNRSWDENHRVLIPEGSPAAEFGLLLLVSDGQTMECLSARSGESIWTSRLGSSAQWASFYEDRLIVGTENQIASVSASTGELAWIHKVGEGAAFSEFQLVEDRLFVREESRRLFCVAATTGAMLWSYEPTDGLIQPHPFLSSQHVALRTKQPGKFIVLDVDGRRRFETTQVGDGWEFPPVAVDAHHLCFASDARTIQLVDLNDGKPLWSYTGPNSDQRPVPIAGPTSLLVLVAGNTIVRLDQETGKPLWSNRISDDVLPRYEAAWAVDGQMFYCITRELNLRAIRLSDGNLAWEQFLNGPGDQWQLVRSDGHMLVLPRRSNALKGLPVVICRQQDGKLLQRLFFKPHGNEAVVHLASPHTIVGSEREVWVLEKDD
jgi:outer membrane protein assembly factor BamB